MAVLLDEDGVPRGSWGPMPEPLQARVMQELGEHSKADRYRDIRTWYAKDRGVTTAQEVAPLVEVAAETVHGEPLEQC